jgi:hypothetical protein
MSEYVSIEGSKANPHRVVAIVGEDLWTVMVTVGSDGVYRTTKIATSSPTITEYVPADGVDKQYVRHSPMSAYWALRTMAVQGKPDATSSDAPPKAPPIPLSRVR